VDYIDNDFLFRKVLGIKCQELQDYSSSYGKMSYLPDLSLSDEFNVEKGWETVGYCYGRYDRWQEIDDNIASSSDSSPPAVPDTPATTAAASSVTNDSLPSSVTSPPAVPETPATTAAASSVTNDSLPSSVTTPPAVPKTPATTAAAPSVTNDSLPSSVTNSLPSSSQPPHWNEVLGRRGDTGLPARRCNRMLGGRMPTATALNTYISDNKPLHDWQPARGRQNGTTSSAVVGGRALIANGIW
jgi:hypothetical protein